jgi:hypothetical protein
MVPECGPRWLGNSVACRKNDRKISALAAFSGVVGNPSSPAKYRRPAPPPALSFIEDIPSRSRGALRPSFDRVHPRKREGAGNAGCTLHPRSRAQWRVECAHEHTGSAEASGIPCVMALRLMPRSPRRRIRLVTVVGGFCGCSTRSGQSKPPPTWHQQRVSGPHGFAVRSNVVRPARLSIAHEDQPAPATAFARRRSRVHHIPSRVRDDARPPLLPERDGRR